VISEAKSLSRRQISTLLGIAGLAVACAGWTHPAAAQSAAQSDQEWEAVVAAAKKEGKLVFYNGTTVVVPRLITKAFEQKYGIQVDVAEGSPSAVRERVRSEQAAGRAIGDVHLVGITTGAPEKAAGTYEPHGYIPNARKLPARFKDDGYMLGVTISRFAILMNTRLVKPEDEPKSWFDLLDPKWKGRMLSGDPRTGGGAQVSYTVFYDKYGKDFLQKLGDQKPEFMVDFALAERRTAQGEFAINYPFNVSSMANLRGLPIKAVMPKEGAPYVWSLVAKLKNAPHPNAARLFMNFFLEDEAQAIYSANGQESTTGVISDKLPEDMVPLFKADLIGTADPFKLPEMVKMFSELYGKP